MTFITPPSLESNLTVIIINVALTLESAEQIRKFYFSNEGCSQQYFHVKPLVFKYFKVIDV